MKLKTLEDLYLDELKDVYDAEHQIIDALPKMAKAASSTQLRRALEEHLEQTKEHVKRLEKVFESNSKRAERKKCDGLKGLLEEGKKLMAEDAEPSVLDAGLIAGAQRVEHYEMAAYGSLKAWATQLDDEKGASLLGETLEEEKAADEKLTQIALRAINSKAAKGSGEKTDRAAGRSQGAA